MKAAAAVKLVQNNPILLEFKLELGIFIGDDDYCTISALRNISDHEIVKQGDKNHMSKGVTSELYRLSKK